MPRLGPSNLFLILFSLYFSDFIFPLFQYNFNYFFSLDPSLAVSNSKLGRPWALVMRAIDVSAADGGAGDLEGAGDVFP